MITILHPQLKDYLLQYCDMREERGEKLTPESPLVVGRLRGNRIDEDRINEGVKRIGRKIGIHLDYGDTDEKFTTHNLRHYFTTSLKENGMKDDYIEDLRGDLRNRKSADGYYHIPVKRLKEEYFRCCVEYDIPDELVKI
ncbi:MAG: tyrosine-type recombinase/integrase [Methanimicrococcus sp.]|nr:tyrosine-type recombinase/integrase [Methanimicrococcus sp.]